MDATAVEISLHVNELGKIPKEPDTLLKSLANCPAQHDEYVKSRILAKPSGLQIADLYGTPIKLFVYEDVIVAWSLGQDKMSDKGNFDDDVSVYER